MFNVAAEYRFWSRDPAAIHESNVRGACNALEACLEYDVGRVVVYTCIVGTIGLGGPRREEPPGLARCEVLSSSGLLGHEAIASSDATPVVDMVIR